jgi:antitoxin component YwqK of YwqJK toxin-antitoxin module
MGEQSRETIIQESGDGKVILQFSETNEISFARSVSNSGVVLSEISYQNGQIHGEVKQFYLSGRIMFLMNYIAGKQSGLFVSFYENGMKQSESNYEEGVLVGPSAVFDEFGDIVMECEYKAGLKHGKSMIYYPKIYGHGIYELSSYEDGLLEGDLINLTPNGEIQSITPYKKGKAQKYPQKGH